MGPGSRSPACGRVRLAGMTVGDYGAHRLDHAPAQAKHPLSFARGEALMAERYFVVWTVKREGVILPEERLPTGPTILVGLQHVVAMFGATVLAPLLMGFDPNVAIFFSGIATLIFFVVTGGRVPSYLGSSFAFIGPVLTATGAAVAAGANANIGVALGGIMAAGALYTVIGLIVLAAGHRWVERLMPPVVTGAIVAA